MFVEFDLLHDSSRVWIYQSVRKFTEAEEVTISKALHSFTQQWTAHGQPLKGSFKIYYNQFVALAADESFNEASGCSIDDSVHAIKEIDQHFKLDIFDRAKVAFLKKDEVFVVPLNELSKAYAQGIWESATAVFNNVITLKSELNSKWIVPAGETWLKRYMTKITV